MWTFQYQYVVVRLYGLRLLYCCFFFLYIYVCRGDGYVLALRTAIRFLREAWLWVSEDSFHWAIRKERIYIRLHVRLGRQTDCECLLMRCYMWSLSFRTSIRKLLICNFVVCSQFTSLNRPEFLFGPRSRHRSGQFLWIQEPLLSPENPKPTGNDLHNISHCETRYTASL